MLNIKKEIYNPLSEKLFALFYVDDRKYGIQQQDGTYKYLKKAITPVTIDDMLLSQKSLLTYQELHILDTAFIKWICIDVDIIKSAINRANVNVENLTNVYETTNELCDFLKSINIQYLLEFSGRRGFHIWIVFEKNITKENGFKLIEYIYEKTIHKFRPNIVADKFPKTGYVSKTSKGVGFGVKLPLSQNKANGKLSFFLRELTNFNFNEKEWISEPNNTFLIDQYNIINDYQLVEVAQIQSLINEYDNIHPELLTKKYSNTKEEVHSFLSDKIDLDEILLSLRQCDHLNTMLLDFEKGLSRKDRSILVGLLIQLRTTKDKNFGYNLLLELFSRIQGFNEKETKNQLEYLKNYQPISCRILGNCDKCNTCNLKSPIELIEGVQVNSIPFYDIKNIEESFFERIILSLDKYLLRNDEVPLYPLIEKNKAASYIDIRKRTDNILNHGVYSNLESFQFTRNETNKIRKLFSIESSNNIVSVYFTYVLNNIFYSEFSSFSYGYRLVPNFHNGNIFQNWFVNWIKFTKKIEDVLFGEEYKEYFLIKIDIKSFYDSINLLRLKLKLFEEASDPIKNRFEEFSEDNISKYKNIINYLIEFSKSITKNDKDGLPQGPAYARYLAEIYLIGLDNLIENSILINRKREFYYRFVDDIFVFIKNEEEALELFSKISEWLSLNDLLINNEKTKLINVEVYAKSGEYHKYKDDAKYDINKANKNKAILSEIEIQKALLKLEQLTNESKFGLKDNLRFFYHNFKDDKRIDFIRSKLAKKLPYTTDGRGTLYYLFYSDLFENFNVTFWQLTSKIEKIKGLSLTHFLNTILLYQDVIPLTMRSNINEILSINKNRDDLSEADKLLLTIISLKFNVNINLNFSAKTMNLALETPGLKYNIESWDSYKSKLQNLDSNKSFLKEIERVINEHTYSLKFLNAFSEYSFTRFSEWSLKKENTDFIDNKIDIFLYFHCLCFLTLFENSTNHTNVEAGWKILIEKSNSIDIINSDFKHSWVNKISGFSFDDFSNQSYNIVLSDKVGSNMSTEKNGLIKYYREVLVTFLFAKEKAFDTLQNNETTLLKYIDDTTLFYRWVKDKTASLYPEDKDICMKNIALNGIIVLKKGNKIFVKHLSGSAHTNKYDYLNVNPSTSINEIEYEYEIHVLDEYLSAETLSEIIVKLHKTILEHEEFMSKYDASYPCFYSPFLTTNSKPLIPFYSDFDKIITFNGQILENNSSAYWQNLLFILSKVRNTKIVNEENRYNFDIAMLEKRFIPNSKLIINNAEDKIDFIKYFGDSIKENSITSIFQFQYFWTKAVLSLIKNSKTKKNLFIDYLKVHFDHFPHPEFSDIDLLFSINETTDPNDESLESFLTTIKMSIEIFQSEVCISEDFNFITDIFEEPILNTDDSEGNSSVLEKKLFINRKPVLSKKWNIKERIFDYSLTIWDKKYDNLEIYLFDNFNNRFFRAEYTDIEILLEKDFVFSNIVENKYIFIYIPEDEVATCFRRIISRLEVYTDAINNNDSETLLLFPINKYYKSAHDVYLESSKAEIERKLEIHYNKNTIDIKARIINWLTIFNDESIKESQLEEYMKNNDLTIEFLYKSILEILNRHVAITNENTNFVKDKMTQYGKIQSVLLFPIKKVYDDNNGLSRLIRLFDKSGRLFDFNKYIFKFYSDCQNIIKEMVIVSDNYISGSQLERAFEYYLKEFENEDELIKAKTINVKERFFFFNNLEESLKFRKNFMTVERIIFLSSISTDVFKERTKKLFKYTFKHKAELVFESDTTFKENDYLLGKVNINTIQFDLFLELIKDSTLIEKLFQFDNREHRKNYSNVYCKNKNYKERNLILRIGSLPAKHIDLFSLRPKKGKPLLDYIRNWEGTNPN